MQRNLSFRRGKEEARLGAIPSDGVGISFVAEEAEGEEEEEGGAAHGEGDATLHVDGKRII